MLLFAIHWNYSGGLFDWDRALIRLEELTRQSEDPTLWDTPERAQKLLKEQNRLQQSINAVRHFSQRLDDACTYIELGESEEDEDTIQEGNKTLDQLVTEAAALETACLFSGEADGNDCFLEIHAGAGGTESHDWANMLLRSYTRWAERHRFKVEVLDLLDGEEAGIKSASLRIQGEFAYGWGKSESGVHRLVRISPFNAAGKRMTSFASVWVYPVVDDSVDIEILDKDLKIDTYRASGAGGQHVNKTESAIRITHMPTGIVVQCQNDRSQHKNKAEALSMLKARLYEAELKKREAATKAMNANKTDNSWGHQIRSYVLQPYQMVKDLRTGHETSDTGGVLDGDLDGFMSAYLRAAVQGQFAVVEDID